MEAFLPKWFAKEAQLESVVQPGAVGLNVRRLQELLCINGYYIEQDGVYGTATRAAMIKFQSNHRLPMTGSVGAKDYSILILPILTALSHSPGSKDPLKAVVEVALKHLQYGAKEVGNNRGQWVRLYMKGYDGADFPWCAGFLSLVLRQVEYYKKIDFGVPYTFSCDVLATNAQHSKRFILGAGAPKDAVKPGYIFLKKRTSDDWVHAGIVRSVFGRSFSTIEGNSTNRAIGSSGAVTSHIRTFDNGEYDFIKTDTQ